MEPSNTQNDKTVSTKFQKSWFRWIVLIMLFTLVFSMIYCYDQLFALQNQLQDKYNLSPLQYNMLYSIYGYVNVILPLISGILIDYIGINTSSLLFYSFIIIGQTIWIFACIIDSYPIMVLGRGIFACGTQPFHTSRKYYLAKYFIGKEYLFASGLTISASRLASAIASFISAQIYICCGIIFALSIGEILVIISFILLILFIIYDKSITKKATNLEKKPLLKTGSESTTKTGSDLKTEETYSESQYVQDKGFHLWESLKIFDKRFWILSCALATFYASYMTFTANQSSFLQARFGYKFEIANDLAMIGFFIATFTAPIFGYICDKFGNKLLFLTIAAILLIISHCILGFADEKDNILPIVGLILFGIAMSLGSAILWPMMLLVCESKYHASALGVSSVIDNGSQATSLIIAGALTKDYTNKEHQNNQDQYEYFTYWVLFEAILMLIFTIWLWLVDKNNILNGKPNNKGKVEQEDNIKDKSQGIVSMQQIEPCQDDTDIGEKGNSV